MFVAARTLDIVEYLERKPSQLSGGQGQRVAIRRSIVRNPKVFLFDEPLSNLDAKLRNQMRAEIISLRHKINITFIYVSHDQIEAMTLGDRIVIMRDGFVQQVGTPTQLFDHPANLFAASFIGTPQMSFFDGVLKVADGKYVVVVNGEANLRWAEVDGASGYIANSQITGAIDPGIQQQWFSRNCEWDRWLSASAFNYVFAGCEGCIPTGEWKRYPRRPFDRS